MNTDIQNRKNNILLVDDDRTFIILMTAQLTDWGYEVFPAVNGEETLCTLAEQPIDVVLLDVRLPDANGIELLKRIHRDYPYCEVLMITAHGSINMAMDCVKHGAFDFHTKPVESERLQLSLRNAAELARSKELNHMLKCVVSGRHKFGEIIGGSMAMQTIYHVIENVAGSECNVLITGETGTGKELVAVEIHKRSKRSNREMISINCAAIPADLLESEVFGHEKGAFTGAEQMKKGCAELADGSTLFLDEIGEMPMALQVKLLRFLQEGSIRRVGGNVEVPVDVRIITATNRHPEQAVQAGQLREDLYYRINVVNIELPMLRDRGDDVAHIAQHLLTESSAQHGKHFNQFEPETLSLLQNYSWPGNVRQLQNVIHNIVVLNEGTAVSPPMLPEELRNAPAGPIQPIGSATNETGDILPLREIEKNHFQAALFSCKGNVQEAARRLEVSRATLYRKIKEYGMTTKPQAPEEEDLVEKTH